MLGPSVSLHSIRESVRCAFQLLAATVAVYLHMGGPGCHICTAQGPRQVLNIAYAGSAVTRLTVDWGGTDITGEWPTVVGDVNGDGYQDFLIRIWKQEEDTWPYSCLIWGGPHLANGMTRELESVPLSRIHHDYDYDGLRPGSRRPFAPAGDLDADGYDDFLIGIEGLSANGVENAGLVTIVFGSANFPADADLADLAAAGLRSFSIRTTDSGRGLGGSVNRVGDLNGDGIVDLAFGARGPGTLGGPNSAGRLYVLFGGLAGRQAIDIAEIGVSVPGFVLLGASGQASTLGGDSLALDYVEGVGDVNGDGLDDLAVPAIGAERAAGAVYVVYGARDLAGTLDAAQPEEFGVEITGPSPDGRFGVSLSGADDVDGDGLRDLLVGQDPTGGPEAGGAYVIYGSAVWPSRFSVNDGLAHLTELRMVKAPPTANPWLFGSWVDRAGDWNADGYADFVVSAAWQQVGLSTNVGRVFLVYGGPALPTFAFDTDIGTETVPGLVLEGSRSGGSFGRNGDLGDVDGDGRNDLLITASTFQQSGRDSRESSVTIVFGGGLDPSELELVALTPPGEGPLEGGTRVELRGKGFGSDVRAYFGGVESPESHVIDSGHIEAMTPPRLSAGPVDVEIAQGAERSILARGFTYTNYAFPDLILDTAELRASGHRSVVIAARGTWPFAGDLDGDGITDLMLRRQTFGSDRARLSIFYGSPNWPETAGDAEVTIWDEAETVGFGLHAELGTDMDGDGLGDILIGGAVSRDAISPEATPARLYVLQGSGRHWPQEFDVADFLADGGGLRLDYPFCHNAIPVSFAAPSGGRVLAVSQVLCQGSEAKLRLYRSFTFEPAAPEPQPFGVISGNTKLNPRTREVGFFGTGLTVVGDMNGDGSPDLAVGENGAIGAVYVLLGGAGLLQEGAVSVRDLMARGLAVRFTDNVLNSNFGLRISAAGDFNGDGLADVAFSAPLGGFEFQGEAYIVFGSRDLGGIMRDVDLSQDGPGHLRITGELPEDRAGMAAGIGDWNGDGFSDLVIRGEYLQRSEQLLYVVFGEAQPPAAISLTFLRNRGFRLKAPSGVQVLGGANHRGPVPGDFNGDGAADLAVPFSIPEAGGQLGNPELSGVFVVFGKRKEPSFVRGEVNEDGRVDLSDAVAILGFLFLGSAEPFCLDAADVNDSGQLDLSDAVSLLSYLFLGALPPPPPFPDPDLDPTEDQLDCL